MERSIPTCSVMLGICQFEASIISVRAATRFPRESEIPRSERKLCVTWDSEKRMWLSGPGKIAVSTEHFSLLPEEDKRKRPATVIAMALQLCCFRLDKVD